MTAGGRRTCALVALTTRMSSEGLTEHTAQAVHPVGGMQVQRTGRAGAVVTGEGEVVVVAREGEGQPRLQQRKAAPLNAQSLPPRRASQSMMTFSRCTWVRESNRNAYIVSILDLPVERPGERRLRQGYAQEGATPLSQSTHLYRRVLPQHHKGHGKKQ